MIVLRLAALSSFVFASASSFMIQAPLAKNRPTLFPPKSELLSSTTSSFDGLIEAAASANSVSLLTAQHSPTEGALSGAAVVGSSLIMLTIVGLLYLWEESVIWVRKSVPKSLLPVVESILAEVGGLGFIGLVLSTLSGNAAFGESLETLSVQFFGEKDILLENFEFFHADFFRVGVGFFIAAGFMVVLGIKKLNEIETVEGLQLDEVTGACFVTPKKLVDYLPDSYFTDDDNNNSNGNGNNAKSANLWKEITMSKEERAAKTLLIRKEFMERYPHLPDTFRMERIIQASFAQNLSKFVELSPLIWICLIPPLALAIAVDLSHEVVNAASPNAAEIAGYYITTFAAIGPATFAVVLSAVWGTWNCWKMTRIKHMLIPRLGIDPATGEAQILPPLYKDESIRKSFDSSPAWVRPIEGLWGKPPREGGWDDLFGTAGSAGIKLYRNSIKYQTWLALTHVIFFGTEIVPRDIGVLMMGSAATSVGDPSHVTAELVTFGSFVLITLVQLALISPRAFWSLCLIACADDQVSEGLLETTGNAPLSSTGDAADSTFAAALLRSNSTATIP